MQGIPQEDLGDNKERKGGLDCASSVREDRNVPE